MIKNKKKVLSILLSTLLILPQIIPSVTAFGDKGSIQNFSTENTLDNLNLKKVEHAEYKVTYWEKSDTLIPLDVTLSDGTVTNTVIGSAPFNSNISIEHPVVEGFSVLPDTPSEMTIDIDTVKNEIKVIYEPLPVPRYKYEIQYIWTDDDGVDHLIDSIHNPISGSGSPNSAIMLSHKKIEGYKIKDNQPIFGKFDKSKDPSIPQVFKLKYDKIMYDYKITYWEKSDTNRPLDVTLADGTVTNTVTGSAPFNSNISIEHPAVEEFNVLPNTPSEITIDIDSAKNEIKVIYEPAPRPRYKYEIQHVWTDDDGVDHLIDSIHNTISGSPNSAIMLSSKKIEGYKAKDNQPIFGKIQKTDDPDIPQIFKIKYDRLKYTHTINYSELGTNKPLKLANQWENDSLIKSIEGYLGSTINVEFHN